MHRTVVALTLLVVVAPAALAQQPKPIAGEDGVAVRGLLGEDALEVLRRADRFALLALIPERRPDRDEDRLRDHPVRAHAFLDLTVRRPLLSALYGDLVVGGAPCKCAGPHHAIVATRGDARVELLLCYRCSWVQVKDEAGERGTTLGRSSEAVLNAALGQTESVPRELILGRTFDEWVERLDGPGAIEARAALAETLVYDSVARRDESGGTVHERWSEARVTLELHNTPVQDALDALGEAARLPLKLTPAARELLRNEAVTATLGGGESSAKDALELLLRSHPDLDLRVTDDQRLVVDCSRPDERRQVDARCDNQDWRRQTVALLAARAKVLRAAPAKALARAALCEEDPRLRGEAEAALAALGHEEGVTAALRALVDALLDVNTTPPKLRIAAARLLGGLPQAATFAASDLANAAESDPDEWVRLAATDAIDRLDR